MKYIITLLFGAALGLAGLVFWKNGSFLDYTSNNHEITAYDTVEQRIQALNRLETSQYLAETLIETSKEGTPHLLWQDSQRGLFIVRGRVSAGLDLSKAQVKHRSSPNGKKESVTILLEAPTIFSVVVDDFKVYDIKTGSLNILSADMAVIDEVQEQARQRLVAKACEMNILDHAREQGVTKLHEMFALADAKVTITVQGKAVCQMPSRQKIKSQP